MFKNSSTGKPAVTVKLAHEPGCDYETTHNILYIFRQILPSSNERWTLKKINQ
jgi:hypothetical protein